MLFFEEENDKICFECLREKEFSFDIFEKPHNVNDDEDDDYDGTD